MISRKLKWIAFIIVVLAIVAVSSSFCFCLLKINSREKCVQRCRLPNLVSLRERRRRRGGGGGGNSSFHQEIAGLEENKDVYTMIYWRKAVFFLTGGWLKGLTISKSMARFWRINHQKRIPSLVMAKHHRNGNVNGRKKIPSRKPPFGSFIVRRFNSTHSPL